MDQSGIDVLKLWTMWHEVEEFRWCLMMAVSNPNNSHKALNIKRRFQMFWTLKWGVLKKGAAWTSWHINTYLCTRQPSMHTCMLFAHTCIYVLLNTCSQTYSYTHRGTYPSRATHNPPPCLKPDLSACSAEFSNRPDFWPLPFLAAHRREDEVPKPLSSPTQKIPCSSSPPTHDRTHTNIVDTYTHRFPFGKSWGLTPSLVPVRHMIKITILDR